MKTAKKLLCLMIVLVMALGMVPFAGASIDDFSDADDINYTEAVAVLAALNVIEGRDTGGFDPSANVTRAEAAAIIARMLLGRANADRLPAGATSFSDVPSSHWASKYISYCASASIIVGRPDGTFAPGDPVTGVQFAIMMMRALGVGDPSRWLGSNWEILAVVDGMAFGILDTDVDYSAPATREQTAKYAFNGLIYSEDKIVATVSEIMIVPGSAPTASATSLLGPVYYTTYSTPTGANAAVSSAYSAAAFGTDYDYRSLTYTQTTLVGSVSENVYGMRPQEGAVDEFGRPGFREWIYRGRPIIGAYTMEPTLVYNAFVAPPVMVTNLSSYRFVTGGAKVTVNGVEAAKVTTAGGVQAYTGNGTRVEIYANENAQITDIVVVKTDYVRVTAVSTSQKSVTFTPRNASPVAPTYTVSESANIDLYNLVKDMRVNDIALIVPVWDGATGPVNYIANSVAFPTTTPAGTFTARNGTANTVTLGGQVYGVSVALNSAVTLTADGTERVFTLDSYGYVIDIDRGTAGINFIFVTNYYFTLGDGNVMVPMVSGLGTNGETLTLPCTASASPSAGNLYSVSGPTAGRYGLTPVTGGTSLSGGPPPTGYVALTSAEAILTTNTGLTSANSGQTNSFAPDVKFFYRNANNTFTVRNGVQNVTIPASSYALVENRPLGVGGANMAVVTAVYIPTSAPPIGTAQWIYVASATTSTYVTIGTPAVAYGMYPAYQNNELIVSEIDGTEYNAIPLGADASNAPGFFTFEVGPDGVYHLVQGYGGLSSLGATTFVVAHEVNSPFGEAYVLDADDSNDPIRFDENTLFIDVRSGGQKSANPLDSESVTGLVAAIGTYTTVRISAAYNASRMASIVFITDLIP